MKAIIMMFDTLTRKYLSAYGNEWVHTPEFKRLEAHTVTFDNFYAASLPCMPARRDLHTGRCSFLHRMWGPLEPFDVSVMERLKEHGVYTHLVTDHSHYWRMAVRRITTGTRPGRDSADRKGTGGSPRWVRFRCRLSAASPKPVTRSDRTGLTADFSRKKRICLPLRR